MTDPESQEARKPGSQITPGHREPTTAERFALIDARNLEANWNGLVDRVKAIAGVDRRQVAIAVTEAEGAFMRLTRAVMRPERIVDEPGGRMLAALREAAPDAEQSA